MPAIRPEEAVKNFQNNIPEEVFEAFNELITQNLDTISKRSSFKLEVVRELVAMKMNVERGQIDSKWLNIEALYEEQGWQVKYESPCIGDNFDAYFEFRYKLVGK